MSVIDLKTRQIEESNRIAYLEQKIADLEHDHDYLRSQLRAERAMKINPPRRKHPLHIVLVLWFLGGFYFLDAALHLYIAMH